jgi:hypothetical protein
MVRTCSMNRDKRDLYKIAGKSEGKRSLGRPTHRWEDINKSYISKVCRCGLNSTGSRYGPVVGSP